MSSIGSDFNMQKKVLGNEIELTSISQNRSNLNLEQTDPLNRIISSADNSPIFGRRNSVNSDAGKRDGLGLNRNFSNLSNSESVVNPKSDSSSKVCIYLPILSKNGTTPNGVDQIQSSDLRIHYQIIWIDLSS